MNGVDVKKQPNSIWQKFDTKNFLNSFFSEKFSKNRSKQIKDLKKYIKKWK